MALPRAGTAQYMFKMTCMAQNIDPFCKYINTISRIIWNIKMEDEDASDRVTNK